MTLLPQEIIRKKRTGLELSSSDISTFFGGYLKGTVADYQVSAMLMAIVLKGMKAEETAALTMFMRDSGEVLKWPGSSHNVIDKHSTGGIGDKTSLIILPLCVLEGLRLPMIAGRGLGHTGGTLDKLESIPGMNVFVDPETVRKIMQDHGGVFMGQTDKIAPLDRRLYAMRDVTDTVESIPLITASILSKKLSEGLGGLVMDVKFGSGAFMQRKEDALALAESIASVGRASGIKVRCVLTDMGSPLGDRAGNALEVIETVEILKGQGPKSSKDLSIDLSIEMILLANPTASSEELRKKLHAHLETGRAFEKFCQIISAQGGDTSVLTDTKKLPKAQFERDVIADKDGFVEHCDCRELGIAVIELGGGRINTTDKIDSAVGLSQLKRVGDKIQKGELLAKIHSNQQSLLPVIENKVRGAYKVGASKVSEPLIWKMI